MNLWVAGARPRTLPAAVVPVAVGTACAVGEVLGTPASATLLRHADGGQTGRSRIDRLAGPDVDGETNPAPLDSRVEIEPGAVRADDVPVERPRQEAADEHG